MAGFKVMLSGGIEDQNPNAAGQLEKYQINLYADIWWPKKQVKEVA